MAERPNEVKVRSPKIHWRRVRDMWPWLIWAFMVVFVIYLFKNDVDFKRMNGFISMDLEPIAPMEAGRVKRIHKEVGDVVAVNDLIAEMDTSIIDKEIAQLKQKQEEERTAATISRLESQRSFAVTYENTLASQAQAEFNLQDDQLEVSRLTDLIPRMNLSVYGRKAIEDAKARLETYKQRVILHKKRLAQAGEAVERALELKTKFDKQLSANDKKAEDQEFTSYDKAIEILQKRRDSMELRATRNGAISAIMISEGDVIGAGQRVAEVVINETERVVGFLPEDASRELTVGTKMFVSPPNDLTTSYETTVTAISPNIIAKSDAQSPLQNRIVRGRKVVLEMPQIEKEKGFLPGQSVIIHTKNPSGLSFLGLFDIF